MKVLAGFVTLAATLAMSAGVAAASGRHCREVSDVVGYERCSAFGSWGNTGLVISMDVGLVVHQFVGAPVDGKGSYDVDGTTYGYRVVSDPGTVLATTAVAPQVRATVVLTGPLYVASELELGAVTSGPTVRLTMDGPNGSTSGVVSTGYFAMRGVTGLRARAGALALSAEIAGGLRAIGYRLRGGGKHQQGVNQIDGELQARARVDYWVTPRVTVGAMIGTSLVAADDRMTGVFIGGRFGE